MLLGWGPFGREEGRRGGIVPPRTGDGLQINDIVLLPSSSSFLSIYISIYIFCSFTVQLSPSLPWSSRVSHKERMGRSAFAPPHCSVTGRQPKKGTRRIILLLHDLSSTTSLHFCCSATATAPLTAWLQQRYDDHGRKRRTQKRERKNQDNYTRDHPPSLNSIPSPLLASTSPSISASVFVSVCPSAALRWRREQLDRVIDCPSLPWYRGIHSYPLP